MPTKLFATTKPSEYYAFSTFITQGGWDFFYSPTMQFMIDTNKYGGPATTNIIATSGPAGWKMGTYRGVTRRLVPQTISGTVDLLMFVHTFSVEMHSRIHIYVVNDATGAVFGTLFNAANTPLTSKWSTAALFPVQLTVNLTPVTIPNDGQNYRIVVEFGAVASNTSFASFQLQQQTGVRKSDMTPAPDILTLGGAPYFEFSGDILLKDFLPAIGSNHEIELATQITSIPFTLTGILHPAGGVSLWYRLLLDIDAVIAFLYCNPSGADAFASMWMQKDGDNILAVNRWINSGFNTAVNHPTKANKWLYFQTAGTQASGIQAYKLFVNGVNDANPTKSGDLLLTSVDNVENMYDPTIKGLYSTLIRDTNGSNFTATGKLTSSKLAVSLYAGRFGMVNEGLDQLFIYGIAPSFNLLKRVNTAHPLGPTAIGTDFGNFYILGKHPDNSNGENRFVTKFNANGIFQPLQWILPVAEVGPLMGVSRNSEILYYGHRVAGGKVKRHDLKLSVGLGMPDFVANPGANFIPEFVVTMSDGSIVCLFRDSTLPSVQNTIYHFQADGTLWHTAILSFANMTVRWISHAPDDDPDKIWIRYEMADGRTDGFIQLRLSTGTYLISFGNDFLNLTNGVAPQDTGCALPIWGPQRFGVMVTLMNTPNISGIYYLNPANTHDIHYRFVDTKIPDPTIRTALLGE
jgi:hypothetical protein